MSYDEKDWIALECCPICGKERGIAFHQRMSKTLPKRVTPDPHLCDDCLKDAKENGWFIIYECGLPNAKNQPNFTGRFVKANIAELNPNIDEKTKKFVEDNRFVLMCEEDFSQLEKNHGNNNEC